MTVHLSRRLRAVAIVVLVAVITVAVVRPLIATRTHAPPRVAVPGDLQPVDCWFDTATNATCAWLRPTVQNQASDTALPVVVLAPTAERSPKRVSIYLSGGPGGSSYLYEEGIAFWREWMQRLGLDHDLVLYDTRGAGYAYPELACPEYEPMLLRQLHGAIETHEQQLAMWNEFETTVQRCLKRLPAADLAAGLVSTRQHARDLLDLVAALRRDHGYDEVVLYGVSYGSRLAAWASSETRTPQERIDRIVLDSYYPPGVDLDLRTPRTWREALSDVEAMCADNGDCSGSATDLVARVERLVSAAPLAQQVVDIDLGEYGGEQRHVALRQDGYNYIELLMHVLSADLLPESLPRAVDEALAGEWDEKWDALAISYLGTILDDSFGNLAFTLAECADGPDTTVEEIAAMRREEPTFASVFQAPPEALDYCHRLGIPKATLSPRTNRTPALVVAMRLDPITPWRVAQAALTDLPHAHWRLIDGAGHGVADVDDCAARAIGRYMNSGGTPDFEDCDLIDTRDPE